MKIANKLLLAVVSATFGIAATSTVFAQTATTEPNAVASTDVVASAAKPTRAERKQARKAARKAARAKKNVELKKLEDTGYQPGRANDANYPQDLQNAQKKAGIGAPTAP